MRITVDTNILISATFWKGDSLKIINLVENGVIELFLSQEIIEEFSEVLNYKEIQEKIKNKNLEMKRTVEEIITLSSMVIPKRKVDLVKSDSDDNKIIECALEGRVDYIITNDAHLLDLKEVEGIKILKPADFLKIVENK